MDVKQAIVIILIVIVSSPVVRNMFGKIFSGHTVLRPSLEREICPQRNKAEGWHTRP
jgi:hypothetical protein